MSTPAPMREERQENDGSTLQRGDNGGDTTDARPHELKSADRSNILKATYLKFEMNELRRQDADAARTAREQLSKLRLEQDVHWEETGSALVRERYLRQKRLRKVRKALIKEKQQEVKVGKAEAAQGEERRRTADAHYHEIARLRVTEASQLDARLDALEEAKDERERQQGAKTRGQLASDHERVRRNLLHEKRASVFACVRERAGLVTARSACESIARHAADEVREGLGQQHRLREQREQTYLAHARAAKTEAEATQRRMRAALHKLLQKRRKLAKRERENNYLVAQERARILESNRREVAAVYSARFASREEAHRLHVVASQRRAASRHDSLGGRSSAVASDGHISALSSASESNGKQVGDSEDCVAVGEKPWVDRVDPLHEA